MPCFTKKFDRLADSIITEAVILDKIAIVDGEMMPKYYFTENACWDTGAQFTIISPRVIEKLGLRPTGKGEIKGVCGDTVSCTYTIQFALPCGELVHNLTVYCSDIDDYDILIGMDVIALTDFVISGKEDSTTFSFRYPSQGDIELK